MFKHSLELGELWQSNTGVAKKSTENIIGLGSGTNIFRKGDLIQKFQAEIYMLVTVSWRNMLGSGSKNGLTYGSFQRKPVWGGRI